MAKYVQPNFIVDSSAAFLRNVTFDSSVYLKGTTHIDAPGAVTSGTPTALVLESNAGDDQIIKSVVLGTMSFETSTNYYGKTAVDTLITDVSTVIDARLDNVDLSLGLIDTALDDKVSVAGDTMTGLLNLAAQGFSLDGVTITTIDTSAAEGLGQLDTAIPTSGAVSKAIAEAIVAGVTASNGLTEVGSDIQLGGTLSQPTTITADSTNTLSLAGLQTSTADTPLALVQDTAGTAIKTRALGTMAWATATDYTLKSLFDSSVAAIWTKFGYVDSSLTGLDLLTQQHTSDIADVSARVNTAEAAGVANGLQILGDGSIGLGGVLLGETFIDASDYEFYIGAGDYFNDQTAKFGYFYISPNVAGFQSGIGTDLAEFYTSWEGGLVLSFTKTGIIKSSASTGIEYFADYSADFTNRSLIDKGYVNSQDTIRDASIIRIDGSLGILNNWNVAQDASIVDLRGTTLSALQTANNGLTANDTSVALGGTLLHNTDINTGAYYLSVTGDMRVVGDLTVDGSVTYVNSVNLNVSDNIITLNYGETGPGVTKTYAGIAIDRGSSTNYFFGFAELTETFRIGIQDEGGLPANTQAVATREDTPVAFGVPFWNGTEFRFDTSAGLIFTPGVGLSLPIATNDLAEATALMINGSGLVVSRELGTNAFSSDTYVLQSLFDSSVAAIWTKLGYVDSSVSALDTLTQTHTTDINNLESSVGALDTLTQSHTQSITDLSTGKLDAVASTTGVSGTSYELYSGEADNVAYIKRLVAGTGATITQDASTVTIAVTGASGYVRKYTGTFNGTAGTELSIAVGTHGLGVGPLSVTVYEGTDQVYVDVDCAANGDITLNWSAGSLSASCKYIIMG